MLASLLALMAAAPVRAQESGVTPPVQRSATGVLEIAPELVNGRAVERAIRRNYPPELRRQGIRGTVMLRMRVLADGSVDSSTVTAEVVRPPEFAEAAIKVALMMRFRPASVGGTPVAAFVTLPVVFFPDGGKRLPTTSAADLPPAGGARP
jgi:protein TonB